ncbi:hypothetical protein E1301_Tti018426 [Triplophysa tibetana]|uniref:Uncharacterized protein n=1 Tax=Triplophysa tibetana TaxID=1572043 RepID=A0A5A9PFB3_9TELE|nr:hypothetical protein E1301_Tti018426 [Triplophysa tibetana]
MNDGAVPTIKVTVLESEPQPELWYITKKMLLNKRLLKDVGKLSPHQQTSALEAFHSVILRFTLKSVVFMFISMLCRLDLAGMLFNENADREQATTLEDTPVYYVMYPKSKKGQRIVKPKKTEPTFGYISYLVTLLFTEVFDNPEVFVEELRNVPIPEDLSAQCDEPSKEELVAWRHVSMFNPVVAGSQRSSDQHQETPGESSGQHMQE